MNSPDLETIAAFKAFGPNWKCRGHQFEVGKTYTHDGDVTACESGYHSCENPLDVLNYYDLTTSKFAEVEASGKISRHEGDSKFASASIKIKAELTLSAFIGAAVKWVIGNASKDSKAGDRVKAASGHYAQLAASGHSAQLAASGDSAQLAASGDSAQLAASGHSAKLAASGNSAQLAASGHYAKLAASGNSAQLAASGDSAQLAASGDSAVIASSAFQSQAKGANGTWIALAEFDGNYKCIGFAVGCIGKDGLLPDTYYCARNGKLEVVK